MATVLPRILIIDDQMESVALLVTYLREHPLEIMVALDGVDGLRKAVDGQPDVILLDVSMPQMDGFVACRRLKADPATSEIPVIFLSANTSVAHKLEGFSAGGVDYVGKPFSAEEVLARLYVHLKPRLLAAETGIGQNGKERSIDHFSISRDDQIVNSAIAELRADDTTWLGLDVFSRKQGTNEKKLTELFRQRFGMTVFEYFIDLRLEKARIQLSNTDRQIQLIADQAGYKNSSDFSRAFRRRYGLGPREYRQTSRTTDESSDSTEDESETHLV